MWSDWACKSKLLSNACFLIRFDDMKIYITQYEIFTNACCLIRFDDMKIYIIQYKIFSRGPTSVINFDLILNLDKI